MTLAIKTIRMAMAILMLALFALSGAHAQSNVSKPPPPPAANIQTLDSQSDFWSQLRHGKQGKGGQLIQSQGEDWRLFRNGPLKEYTSYGMLGILILLALFFLIRGRVKIDHGWSGYTVERFNMPERCGHWILAVSFVILGLTGLNVAFGKHVLLPVISKEAFSTISILAKYLHNYVAFAFILGLAWVFIAWIKDNFPRSADLKWFLQGGGFLIPGKHPPSHKFNAGQKIIFWLVILLGASISLSGWVLLFPFETAMFAKTFSLVNSVAGTDYPTQLSAIQEQQYAVTWHNMMAIVMICVILAHIYIGTIGMQGAFDAMGSGRVDLNWAKEHHSLWIDKLENQGKLDLERDQFHEPEPEPDVRAQPAE